MNVRWDAVVDRAATAVDHPYIRPLPLRAANPRRTENIRIRVQLFGALASLSAERTIKLDLPSPVTIARVLTALKERLGEVFLARVINRVGAKHSYCRLFVDGYPVENLQTLLHATANPTEIEIILLITPEGG